MNCRTLTTLALLGASTTFSATAMANPGMPAPAGHVDSDGDGYFAQMPGGAATPAGYEIDCDDDSAAVNPGAREIPGNGRRDDCAVDGSGDLLADDPLIVQDDSEVGKWSRGPWYGSIGGINEALLTADIDACEDKSDFDDGGCSVNYDDYTFEVSNPDFTVGYFCAFGTLEFASAGSMIATCVPNRTKADGLDIIPVSLAATLGPARGSGLGSAGVNRRIESHYDEVIDPRFTALEARATAGEELDEEQNERLDAGDRMDTAQNSAIMRLQANTRRADRERAALLATAERHDREIGELQNGQEVLATSVIDLQGTGIQLAGLAGYRYMGMTPINGDDGTEEGIEVRSGAHSFMAVGARLDYVVVPQFSLGLRGEYGFGGDDVAGDSSDRVWLLGGGATYRFLMVPGLELGANFQGGRLTSAQNPIFFAAQDNLFVAELTVGYEVMPSTRARIKIEGFAGGGNGSYSVLGTENGDEVVSMGKGSLSTFGIRLHLGGDRPVIN